MTGFLGAGKTTLVKRFLETPQGRGTAVIVNEFGAVGIDDALLRGSSEETVLLGNGCLCCTTRTDLQLALRRLVFERERGQVPPFVRILIETSGLADPGPILQTFSTDRALGDAFFIEAMIAVIDAAAGIATLDWSAEARKQAIFADRIVVSKTDIASAEAVAQTMERLRSLNSQADIKPATAGQIDPSFLTDAQSAATNAYQGFVAEAAHSDGILSFVWREERPVWWDGFGRAMETLIALRGPDLLRVKGFLDVEGCSGPVLVQFVQHLAHPPVELTAWPAGTRASRLVFITRNIAEAQVRSLLQATTDLRAS